VTLNVERVFPNLTFTRPVGMLQAPNDATRWFVIGKPGVIHVFDNQPNVQSPQEFLNITQRVSESANDELGLLGLAFHPDWPANRRFYVFYSGGNPLSSFVSEFMADASGTAGDPNSERQLIRIQKPGGQSNHNGGNIAFGPDGFLYIGVGDGGGGNDQHGAIGNGQLRSTLHGKILRIDVNTSNPVATPYLIPSSNPFASVTTLCRDNGNSPSNMDCPEIYAMGFRNPWRWSFDKQTGDLFVGDVGQSAREEVDRVVLGGNYGWRCFEGTRNTGMACGSEPNLLPPIAEYDRSFGQSITGGYVYRGKAFPQLVGRYVFGDFIFGNIWSIAADTQPTLDLVSANVQPFDSDLAISSFAEDSDGELYVVHYGNNVNPDGALYRLTVSGGP
jgi:glucose/arabinose dehydrogenase